MSLELSADQHDPKFKKKTFNLSQEHHVTGSHNEEIKELRQIIDDKDRQISELFKIIQDQNKHRAEEQKKGKEFDENCQKMLLDKFQFMFDKV